MAEYHTGQRRQPGQRDGLKPICKAKAQGTKEPWTDTSQDVNRMTLLSAQVGNDLLIRGTAARSSDETPVMGVERRGIVNADLYVNRKSRKP